METSSLPIRCTWLSFEVLQDALGRQMHYAFRAGHMEHFKQVRKLKDELERAPDAGVVKFCLKSRLASGNRPGCKACMAVYEAKKRKRD